jgi:hypothetical protein
MEQYAKLKGEIQDAIEGVKDIRQRTVLRLRFIERPSFREQEREAALRLVHVVLKTSE